ncbi:hypothetical protein MPTK1_4g16200 [Marchantia polymorpha subsp. ruderalis]|uniref:Uncharacterized protein n=2 Tax=Marchantia polymorpha TaxID=3197 RepID=A0AAF6BAF7_MARPO|nr:hypothetical protein MARPO_0054s0085 [Marchantia polymorpha]BBN08991.1 hypothetical protein Mp_4g16200 [Marchantia polymorpha subsp. ruderalis]|eukprot:PTQ37978.1 hypothetical protein MARPO_0054s0085 [Marchantia polymorpha]
MYPSSSDTHVLRFQLFQRDEVRRSCGLLQERARSETERTLCSGVESLYIMGSEEALQRVVPRSCPALKIFESCFLVYVEDVLLHQPYVHASSWISLACAHSC